MSAGFYESAGWAPDGWARTLDTGDAPLREVRWHALLGPDDDGRTRTEAAVSFEGFPDEGLVFYEGLEADNSKTYWTQHKADYDAHVRAPLLALLDELAPEFGTAKVFRPYRDVRFSNDKTPYKTHQGAVVHADGARAPAPGTCRSPPTACTSSGGSWRLESDQVARYRRAVADAVQGPRLQAEVDRLPAAGLEHRGREADPGAGRLLRGRRAAGTAQAQVAARDPQLGAGGLAARRAGRWTRCATPGAS